MFLFFLKECVQIKYLLISVVDGSYLGLCWNKRDELINEISKKKPKNKTTQILFGISSQ